MKGKNASHCCFRSVFDSNVRKSWLKLALVLFTFGVGPAFGEIFEIPLYEDGIPGAIEVADQTSALAPTTPHFAQLDVSLPALRIYLPEPQLAEKAAVVICPGGGYHHLALHKEGYLVAEALNRIGVAAIVLKYRLPDPKTMKTPYLGPLQDIQQALVKVRNSAKEWGIDPARVGVMGFSAGGHLAASAATMFNQPAAEFLDGEKLRPDFAMLIYPVITMTREFGHEGSRNQLLGAQPSPELIDAFSLENQITTETPATFLVHSGDDQSVPVENSLMFYRRLNEKGVPSEMHIYPAGGHGYGLDRSSSSDPWFGQMMHWLRDQGWVTSNHENNYSKK